MTNLAITLREVFQDYLGLRIVFREQDHGVTRISLDAVANHGPEVGSVTKVYLWYPEGEGGDFNVVLVSNLDAYVFTGFAWGYGGEGPRGLISVLKLYGFDVPQEFPGAHIPGLWRIDKGNPVVHELTY